MPNSTPSTRRDPSFATALNREQITPTGARLRAHRTGKRWSIVEIDRFGCTGVDGDAWPASTREVMAALASDLSQLFVYSHTRGSCGVSTFSREWVHLSVPTKAGHEFTTALLLAELGNGTDAAWILEHTNAAVAEMLTHRSRMARTAAARLLVDMLAHRVSTDYRNRSAQW